MEVNVECWRDVGEIPAITALLHVAYGGLAKMGFRYLATHQGDVVTGERLRCGESFVARETGEAARIVGTVNLRMPGMADGTPWYRRLGVAVFGQFAVVPECQWAGIGSMLMEMVEARAL